MLFAVRHHIAFLSKLHATLGALELLAVRVNASMQSHFVFHLERPTTNVAFVLNGVAGVQRRVRLQVVGRRKDQPTPFALGRHATSGAASRVLVKTGALRKRFGARRACVGSSVGVEVLVLDENAIGGKALAALGAQKRSDVLVDEAHMVIERVLAAKRACAVGALELQLVGVGANVVGQRSPTGHGSAANGACEVIGRFDIGWHNGRTSRIAFSFRIRLDTNSLII